MTVLDSLFKQSIAVLATAILAAVVVSVLLIATFVLRPQLDRAAATTAEMAERLGESFAEMEPPQRQFLIDTLRGGPRSTSSSPRTAPTPRSSSAAGSRATSSTC